MKYLVVTGIALVSFASCVTKTKKEEALKNVAPASLEKRDEGGLKICFYNQDSLQIHFKYFREQDSIITKKQLAYQNKIQRKSQNLQNYIIKYEERAKEKAIMQLQQTEGARLEEETYNKMEVIGNKIEFFAAKYSEENEIDLFLVHARGGQFKYLHSSMDVTKEFTEYLNQHQDDLIDDLEK